MIGIVGGLGLGAGIHYYKELAAAHEAEKRPLELAIVHAQMSRIFEFANAKDSAGLAKYLASVLGQLKGAGATIAAIPAVTPHLCVRELLPIAPVPIINLLDVIRDDVRARGLQRIALFGTRFVIDSSLFGWLEGVTIVKPQPSEVDYIHNTYFSIASRGAGSDAQRDGLTALAKTLCERDGVEAVLLAGTDLSAIFNASNTGFPHIDCAALHIRAIMQAANAG